MPPRQAFACPSRARRPTFRGPERLSRQPQLRAHFSLGPSHYNLVVTDMEWEFMAVALNSGEYTAQAFGLPESTRLLFTISLGEPTESDGASYKIVAGIIPLPLFA